MRVAREGRAPVQRRRCSVTASRLNQPDALVWDESAQIGLAALLLADTDRNRLSIAAMLAWVMTPIRLGQIIFIFNPDGRPLGYATWAYLADETEAGFRDGSLDLLSIEDWNDGEHLWIVDVVAPYGNVNQLASALRATLQERHHRFEFIRQRRGKLQHGVGRLRQSKAKAG